MAPLRHQQEPGSSEQIEIDPTPTTPSAISTGTPWSTWPVSRDTVRRATSALEPVAGRYLFVSSVSAYASHRELWQDEDAPLLPPLASDVMDSMTEYGQAKVACEQGATAVFGAGAP